MVVIVAVIGGALAFFMTMNTGKTTPETVTKTVTASSQVSTRTVTETTTKTTGHESYTTSPSSTTPTSHSETTTTPLQKGEMSFELNCEKGSTLEAVQAYKRTGDYCWGWLGSHTYNWHAKLPVDKISGIVKIGPNEGGKEGTLYVEVSSDGGSYTKVWSKSVRASSKATFTVDLGGKEIEAIRVRVNPQPPSNGWISVDYTDINVTLSGQTSIIEHDCHEGVHMEAQEAYSRSGDYCWGWLKTQTYDIGVEKELEYAVVYVRLGPSNTLDTSGGLVDIMLSSDGEHWEKMKEINIVGGGPIMVIAVKGNGEQFRYIRIAASDETPGHYIDYSAIDLAVRG